ncbi:hypothetical protein [Bradyrhizobium tropiciagri]|uniref:hypothetical protein n=1 Tax=Bradyrhizobium tropiciagri TaxID=312253 RepID=UPI001009B056|nr:hypothetical protein [Bradyrhizobium tropiciagri]
MSLHTTVDGLPSGDTGAMLPIELTPIGVRVVPKGFAGIDIVVVESVIVAIPLAVDVETVLGAADMAGVAKIDGKAPVEPPTTDIEVTGTAMAAETICGIGVAQVTYVPDIAGFEANGTGASVVPGVPGCVVAENGPGPVSGDVTITAGVVGIPMAVVPIVETCAKLTGQPSSRTAAVNSERRIAIASFEPI